MNKDQNYTLRANNIPRVSRRNLDPDEILARNVFTLKPTIITRHCRTCHELKPLNDFYLVSASKRGRRTETECIPCWDHRSRMNKKS
jgi:RNase P subunit RPR2